MLQILSIVTKVMGLTYQLLTTLMLLMMTVLAIVKHSRSHRRVAG